jgi:hypothetical protein
MPLPNSSGNFSLRKVDSRVFYTTPKPTNAAEVATLVADIRKCFVDGTEKKVIWVLSGTHGDASGELVKERDFFYEDKALEGQIIKSVDVWLFTTDTKKGELVSARWKNYLDKKLVVFAWCYSEMSKTGWMRRLGYLA